MATLSCSETICSPIFTLYNKKDEELYKVIGYIRVSGEAQDLERQRALIKSYCARNGYYLVRIIEDNAVSGSVANRSGLNELLALDPNEANCIIVSELSRISRQEDVMNALMQIHQIISKFDLVMLDEPDKIYHTGERLDMMKFLTLAIKAYGAAEERKKIAERMKTGKQVLVAKFPLTIANSNIYYGFKKVVNPKYTASRMGEPHYFMEVDEEKMGVVRNIFEWIASGLTISKVCEKLVARGLKAPKGGDFNATLVRRIIHNEIYKGIRTYAGNRVEIGVEFVQKELWEQANSRLQENNARAEKFTVHYNPLKGILKCPCGCNTTIYKTSMGFSYICVSRLLKNREGYIPCEFSSIRVNVLLAIMWFEIKQIFPNKDFLSTSNKKIEALKRDNYDLEAKNLDIEKQIKRLEDEQHTIIENIAFSKNDKVVIALNKKVDEIEKVIMDLQLKHTSIRRLIVDNQNTIDSELNVLKTKEVDKVSIENRKKIYSDMMEKVMYCSTEPRIGYVIIQYKNGFETIYVYDNTNVHKRKVYRVEAAMRFNPNTNKVCGGWYGPSMDFSKVEVEYSPSELLKEFVLRDVSDELIIEDYE